MNFIDSCIKSFLNKLYTPKVVVPSAPKRNVFVKLPLLGSTSFQILKKLQKLFNDKLTSCNLKIVFTSPVRVKSFFTFKDTYYTTYHLPPRIPPTYYRKTKRHFKVRIYEHLGISYLTEKKVKDWQQQTNDHPRTSLML